MENLSFIRVQTVSLKIMKNLIISLNKTVLLSTVLLFSATAMAEKISCPASLQINNKPHRLNDVSLFSGPPEERGELIPDTEDDTVWTIRGYPFYDRTGELPFYLVCKYKGTKETVTLKVPDSAKKCSAWLEGGINHFFAACE